MNSENELHDEGVSWDLISQMLRYSIRTAEYLAAREGSSAVSLLHLFCGILSNDNTVTRIIADHAPAAHALREAIAIRFNCSQSAVVAAASASGTVSPEFSSGCHTAFVTALNDAKEDTGKRFIDELHVSIALLRLGDPDVEALISDAQVSVESLSAVLAQWREAIRQYY